MATLLEKEGVKKVFNYKNNDAIHQTSKHRNYG